MLISDIRVLLDRVEAGDWAYHCTSSLADTWLFPSDNPEFYGIAFSVRRDGNEFGSVELPSTPKQYAHAMKKVLGLVGVDLEFVEGRHAEAGHA